MDPNQALEELRELVDRSSDILGRVDSDEFAEKFAALDEWISNGGFLPGAWSR